MSALTTASTLAAQSFLSYKALAWGGFSAYAWNRLGRPVFFVTMFALAGRFAGNPGAAEAYIIGMCAAAIPATILDGILPSFTIERNGAMLPFLFVSRVNRVALLWARGALHLANSWVSVGISLLFSAVILQLDCSRLDWGTLAASIAAISWSCTAFALFAANFSLLLRAWTDLSALLQGLVIACTGAVIPLALLPEPLALLGQALPLTAGLVAFRDAFAGAPAGAVAGSLTQEIFLGLAYAALAGLVFAGIEMQAKRRGSLDWESE
jgi:ABC-type polysaccharide/polyol phosphate export permease